MRYGALRATPISTPSTRKSTRLTAVAVVVVTSIGCVPIACAPCCGETNVMIAPKMIPMLTPDTTLGPYRLIQQIGAGGMGEVWKAEDTRLGRIVAIKILPPAIAADSEALARMRREARMAAQLHHP